MAAPRSREFDRSPGSMPRSAAISGTVTPPGCAFSGRTDAEVIPPPGGDISDGFTSTSSPTSPGAPRRMAAKCAAVSSADMPGRTLGVETGSPEKLCRLQRGFFARITALSAALASASDVYHRTVFTATSAHHALSRLCCGNRSRGLPVTPT